MLQQLRIKGEFIIALITTVKKIRSHFFLVFFFLYYCIFPLSCTFCFLFAFFSFFSSLDFILVWVYILANTTKLVLKSAHSNAESFLKNWQGRQSFRKLLIMLSIWKETAKEHGGRGLVEQINYFLHLIRQWYLKEGGVNFE